MIALRLAPTGWVWRIADRNRSAILLVVAVAAGFCPAAAESGARECFGVPPSWESRVVYFNSFGDAEGSQCNEAGLVLVGDSQTGGEGAIGRCWKPSTAQPFVLRGEALSPHRPLAVSFWWALERQPQENEGFGLFHLSNGRGMVSLFARGGPWCALTRTAGVFQVYYFDGIVNVNGIYDRALFEHLDVRAGVWHHSAVVFSAASFAQVYVDGREVFQVRLKGRAFRTADGIRELVLGSRGGVPVALDEIAVLDRPLLSAEVGRYVEAVRQMRAVGWRP